jgi:hypothetical protein
MDSLLVLTSIRTCYCKLLMSQQQLRAAQHMSAGASQSAHREVPVLNAFQGSYLTNPCMLHACPPGTPSHWTLQTSPNTHGT